MTWCYATIDAPFGGVVTSKPVEPGILATPGTTLLILEKTDRYRLEVMVEENRLNEIILKDLSSTEREWMVLKLAHIKHALSNHIMQSPDDGTDDA